MIPEICVADNKVWWHPVGATDPALLVFEDFPSLQTIIGAVRDEFIRHRLETDLVAASFPCAGKWTFQPIRGYLMNRRIGNVIVPRSPCSF
ncbi:MAG: hypothetical protein ACYDDZ_10085 [Acidimicrobiales bacterium]